jgi:hypothetical protein
MPDHFHDTADHGVLTDAELARMIRAGADVRILSTFERHGRVYVNRTVCDRLISALLTPTAARTGR